MSHPLNRLDIKEVSRYKKTVLKYLKETNKLEFEIGSRSVSWRSEEDSRRRLSWLFGQNVRNEIHGLTILQVDLHEAM